MNDTTLSAALAANSNDIGALRRAAKQNSPEALKEAAKQFEALFMNMVMKSMRNATPQDGILDSQQTKMYTSMFDQELSQHFAKRGVGLADAMLRQLSRNNGSLPPSDSASPTSSANSGNSPDLSARQQAVSMLRAYGIFDASESRKQPDATADSPQAADYTSSATTSQKPHVKAFQDRFAASADEASRATGIPADFMLGQAALESGWGKKEIFAADGSKSYNLFGIKATKGWTGKVAEVATTEYVNGKAQRKMEKFRAYNSYDESFQDYARLISTNPRYRNVMANSQDAASFAQGLQRAGYATDPNYAAKLTNVIRQSRMT
jgi:flagellar protein FlgJ